MKSEGVPILYIEQKPPVLFKEIEMKERGEKFEEGGSYRCPDFEPPEPEPEPKPQPRQQGPDSTQL